VDVLVDLIGSLRPAIRESLTDFPQGSCPKVCGESRVLTGFVTGHDFSHAYEGQEEIPALAAAALVF
jgi:hypothetical protein